MSCPWVEAATCGWVGKGCFLNVMQKESAILRFRLAVRISSGLLKACLMSVEMKGRWGKQLEKVHSSLGGKSVCRARATSWWRAGRWTEVDWESQVHRVITLGTVLLPRALHFW